MKTTSSSMSRAERYNSISLARPIVVSLSFFLAVVAFRSIDVFMPGLDSLPDKTIVSRLLRSTCNQQQYIRLRG